MAVQPDPQQQAFDAEQEYIKALIEYVRDDSRQVYVKVTGALAVAALFVTQLPFDRLHALDFWARAVMVGGLGLLIAGAVASFVYTGVVHHARLEVAECLRTGNGNAAKHVWSQVWARRTFWVRNKVWFWGGDVLFGVGGLCLAVVLGALVFTGDASLPPR